MIGNSDIFDEDELLAIANDGGESSSSSVHSSAESDGASERLNLHSPAAVAKAEESNVNDLLPDAKKATGSARGGDTTEFTAPPSHGHSEPPPAQNRGGGEENDSSSSDDDDGGFLESLLEAKSWDADESTLVDAHGEDDKVNTESQIEPDLADAVKSPNNLANRRTNVELGASVLQWISFSRRGNSTAPSQREAIPDAGGVVAIQHSEEDRSSALPYAMLRLTTSDKNSRGGQRVGGEYGKATIEDISEVDTADRRGKKLGRSFFATGADKASTPGAMVDCLARYDPQRGGYVLEMVDLHVDKLAPISDEERQEDANQSIADTHRESLKQPAALFDPRSIAKRAEEQVRKLKRGKSRAETPRKKRKKRHKRGRGGASAEKKK